MAAHGSRPARADSRSAAREKPPVATKVPASLETAGVLDRIERSPLAAAILLSILTLLVLLPFAGKAVHIDDTLFLKAARQISEKPFDPYGFDVNWYGAVMRMSEVTKNPPLASYYMALAGWLMGWSEVSLHLAFLLPAVGAVLGTFFLARRLCGRAILAGFIALSAPVFVVSSTTLMCDTIMLALWVWAVLLWIEGLDRGDPLRLGGSAALVAASALTKYYGMTLIPLLVLYALLQKRRLGAWIAYLAIPVAVLAGYHGWSYSLYGRGLLSDAASYATERSVLGGNIHASRVMVGLAFAGGCVLPALFYAPRIWKRVGWIVGAVAAAVLGAVVGAGWLAGNGLNLPDGFRLPGAAQFALFSAGGMSLLALVVADLRRVRDAAAWLLAAWLAGTFVFASLVNWTVNGRSMLPIVPAAAVLLARRVEQAPWGRGLLRKLADLGPAILALTIALWVAWADTRLANSARTAAELLHERSRGQEGTLWFEGHWGFQHYMEAIGAHPIDVDASVFRPGDLVAVPLNNTNLFPIPEDRVASHERFDLPLDTWLTTMHADRAAGFYADVWGPLPFSFGAAPTETYLLLRLKAPPADAGATPPR